ncbi:MAG: c-type cytochrome [Planctomycetota bacterium]
MGILISITVPLLFVATGLINFAATDRPSAAEAMLAKFAINRSIAKRVPNVDNPFAGDQHAIQSGFHHYADTCLACHGAPEVPPKEFAEGLNPPAPDLTESISKRSDAELFWIVKNGIRMTGMPALGPTHNDEDIWKIVSFVRSLPDLSDEQRNQLREALGSGHQHSGNSHQTDSHGHHDHANGHTH